MNSLKNIKRITYTNDMIMTLIKLYKFHGKEFYYTNILRKDEEYFKKAVIEKDTFYLTQILKLNVSEQRLRLIINKDSEPKTNDEKIVRNLKTMISISCENIRDFELNANQIDTLATLVFKGVKRVNFDFNKTANQNTYLLDSTNKSKREDLSELFDEFRSLVIEGKNEITNLICNLYIDFINIKPFKEENELLGLLMVYSLLFKYGFTQFRVVSFFEQIYNNIDTFKTHTIEANYNWKDGYAKVEPLNKFIVDILLDNYAQMEKIGLDYEFDSKLNKTNNIENTILKAERIFTKDYIRSKHPTVSDSTIDRTLKRLRDQGKLKSLGTGRSATWHKINMDHEEFSLNDKLTLFDISNDLE